ncbi:MAG TPA: hypothetical protein VK137_17960 [Planctomycetaceae bacterium]|nr:hypothetical protein [Planctomycetaceae bacterium]
MNSKLRIVNRILVVGLCLSLLMIGWLSVSRDRSLATTAYSAPPTHHEEHNGSDDHAKREAALKKVLDGTVDIYHDAVEVASGKPAYSGLMFVGFADVTGKELLVFSKGAKEHWLIDPDSVISFRVIKGK